MAKAAATDSGPVAKELACWLKAIRLGWTQSVKDEQESWTEKDRRRFRLKYALSGSLTWVIGTAALVLGDPRFLNLISIGLLSAFIGLVLILFAAWVGWLVAFADRSAGPVRLFLDGLLLPTATVAIIALSALRIQSARVESPRQGALRFSLDAESSNGSPPVTLQPEQENAEPPENAPEPESSSEENSSENGERR